MSCNDSSTKGTITVATNSLNANLASHVPKSPSFVQLFSIYSFFFDWSLFFCQWLPLCWTTVHSYRLTLLFGRISVRYHVRHSTMSQTTGIGRRVGQIRGLSSLEPRVCVRVLPAYHARLNFDGWEMAQFVFVGVSVQARLWVGVPMSGKRDLIKL